MSDLPVKSLQEGEEETRNTFNRLKHYYDTTWDANDVTLHVGLFADGTETLEEAYSKATERLFSTLQAEVPLSSASCLLDIGCGAGRTLMLACERFGCRGIGVDVSDEQITDATQELARRNELRLQAGLPPLDIKFIRGSASDLQTLLQGQRCTHAMSQDAILLVGDKEKLFHDVYEHLEPGGVLAVFDFLEERPELRETAEAHLLYDVVHWQAGLSLSAYQSLLLASGFSQRRLERLDDSMMHTYSLLAERLAEHAGSTDATYQTLRERYLAIVEAVRAKKMGWVLFSARKQPRRALICGTKPSSIGRALGERLHQEGWDVWLYSRHAHIKNEERWHERVCDLQDATQIQTLIQEMGSPDAVFFLADHYTGHKNLELLSPEALEKFFGAKITGAVLLANALLQETDRCAAQWVWCLGRPSRKPKSLLTYSITNSAIAGLVEELNQHYPSQIQAYYIPMGIISPSTLGDAYLQEHPEAQVAEQRMELIERIQRTLRTYAPGMAGDLSDVL